jgi:hypothetical protein
LENYKKRGIKCFYYPLNKTEWMISSLFELKRMLVRVFGPCC